MACSPSSARASCAWLCFGTSSMSSGLASSLSFTSEVTSMDKEHSSYHDIRNYLIGFVLSLLLSGLAFWVVLGADFGSNMTMCLVWWSRHHPTLGAIPLFPPPQRRTGKPRGPLSRPVFLPRFSHRGFRHHLDYGEPRQPHADANVRGRAIKLGTSTAQLRKTNRRFARIFTQEYFNHSYCQRSQKRVQRRVPLPIPKTQPRQICASSAKICGENKRPSLNSP